MLPNSWTQQDKQLLLRDVLVYLPAQHSTRRLSEVQSAESSVRQLPRDSCHEDPIKIKRKILCWHAPNTVKNADSVWKYLNKKKHLHISIISIPPSTSFQFHPHQASRHPPDQRSASLQCEALYMAAMFPCKEWPGPTIKTSLFQGVHPGKLTCWTQKWSFGRWFPFQLGDFPVPAVHFQGCADLSLLPFWTVV